MAGTSDIYTSQISQLQTDLQYWQAYIEQTAAVIQTFNDSMEIMQEQFNDMQNTLDALIIRTENLEASVGNLTPYVKLSTSGIIIAASSKSSYSKSIGVFTNQNTIYVYSDKSIDGVTFNDTAIKAMGSSKKWFTSFDGSDTGVQKSIVATSNAKNSKFNLIFSYSSTLDSDGGVKLSVLVNKALTKQTYLLTNSKISTFLQSAIDSGINTSNTSRDLTNSLYVDTTLSAIKQDATAATATTIKKPTSITNVATASNVTSSATKIGSTSTTNSTTTTTSSTSGKTASVSRSSGTSSSVSKKLR